MPESLSDAALLQQTVRVPDHVVHRSFAAETVVLNLRTGRYHGLNPSAGRMLEALESQGSVRDAAATLADAYAQPLERIESDLIALCRGLLERQLIELASGAPR